MNLLSRILGSNQKASAEESVKSQAWHCVPPEQTLDELEADLNGLSEEEAQRRRQINGLNRLPQPPRTSPVVRFFRQFHNILIYVLLAAAAITALLDHLVDMSVIIAVVLANGIIGYMQEGKAETAMAALRRMLAPRATVLRHGRRQTIDGDQVVAGDIVLLEAGDKVPADLRLLKVNGLMIQEAILTGESLAVEKQVESVDRESAVGDRLCMAYSGTTITSGQGRGVVVATGQSTQLGRISEMLSGVETLTTPLVKQMGVFAKWLSFFIMAVSALMMAFGYWVLEYEFTALFMAIVSLMVAAIPAGLPAVLTITLAVGVQAMAKRNAIVRRLPAIETLGAVSAICSDKTGTLTRNEMSVASVATEAGLFVVEDTDYEPVGNIRLDGNVIDVNDYPLLKAIGTIAALCNDAELRKSAKTWTVEGDPMEGALLVFAGKAGIDIDERHGRWTRTDAIPFDAKHKFMATLNHDHEGHASIFIKGAPETILAQCRDQRTGVDGSESLDESYWRECAEKFAASGQRVLAFAERTVKPEHTVLETSDVEGQLTFLGIMGLIDPPRPEAIAAVAECLGAGIQVKMITGDYATTASAIGKLIGLQQTDKVMTGAELDKLDDTELESAVLETDVFARTSPEHKLRLVTALQAQDMIVAMTGDGVNDAPALKRADAGIAMGKNGSEAAKEASELVLADDNFASILAAVREGRTVYDNIKKVISWTLPTNAGESLTILVALMFGMVLPITPIQILWVNMVTAVTLGIALAFEPTEDSTMRRPPRPRDQPLLTGNLVWQVVLVGILFVGGVFGMYVYSISQGHSIELARSMAMNMLVVMEIFYLFYIRNIYGTSLTWKAIRGTKAVWMAVILATFGQLAITYLPLLQRLFGTESIPIKEGTLIIVTGAVFLMLVEMEKQIRLRLQRPEASIHRCDEQVSPSS